MVPEDDDSKTPSLQSLADHCVETGDLIIYVRDTFGWGDLVACLNEFDGDWQSAVKITFSEFGVGMTDSYGDAAIFRWSNFGIAPTLV